MAAEGLLLPRAEGVRHYRHGYKTAGKYSTEYAIWSNMRARCNNPKSKNYERYGARGIRVCERWNADFLNFLEDMGRRPSKELTLDRIDNNKDYTPENCKWSTRQEQCRNRRTSRFIEFHGQSKTLAEWAELSGLRLGTVHHRLKSGWPIEQALTQPLAAQAHKDSRDRMHAVTIFKHPPIEGI